MTVTVVRGLLGKFVEQVKPAETPANSTPNQNQVVQSAQQAAVSGATNRAQTDAVVTSIRSKNNVDRAQEKLEYKEAKQLANDISEKITDDPKEAVGAHQGLGSNGSPREHFA